MEYAPEKRFPVNSNDYKLYEEVGEGVSATVYRALCIPLNEIVAIKVLDLERCNNDLDGIRREVQTMTLIDHPNVLQAHCSFVTEKDLWVVMPYMSGGSCLHIMKSAYSEGFEETAIATILREVLKALTYLHSHGHIHRDVKAGNILVDYNGAVKLADFGVSACMFDTGDRQRSRNTFVGTPCWMAPEVMQQLHGYNFKADVWSFGITALELAHGHAPFSKYPPMKVLLMTLQNAPPGLDYERDKRFSKSFKEMVAACLVKDPKKRPTSEKLLKHSFFKHARSYEYLARSILDGLPPLGDRFNTLKAKEADLLMQNKGIHGNKEHLSQQEYIRGISAWNFNLEDLKAQAALIPDDDEVSNGGKLEPKFLRKEITDVGFAPNGQPPESINNSNNAAALEDLQHTGGSLTSFPAQSLLALKDCFDVCDDDLMPCNPNQQSEEQNSKENNGEKIKSNSSLPQKVINPGERQKFLSGSLLPDQVLFLSKRVSGDADRDNLQQRPQSDRNYSGPLINRQKKDVNNSTQVTGNMYPLEDTSEGSLVQRKGRFKVTSADLSPKCGSTPTFFANQAMGTPSTGTVAAASILPSLQYILQQNAMQRDQIMKLIKCLEQTSGLNAEFADTGIDVSQLGPVSRERELQSKMFHLQQSYASLSEELQRMKLKNAQLERQISTLNKESKVS